MSFLRQFIRWITSPFRFLFWLPVRVISAPRRLMGMSLPMRVAVTTSVLMLVCAAVAFVSMLLTEDHPDPWYYFEGFRKWVLLALWLTIPLAVYFAVKSWIEGEVSQYPDIDEAWRAGLAALEENGLDLTDIPIFLVLGGAEERLIKSLFRASRMDFAVRHVPAGRQPLHWYAHEEGIFLVCRDASHLSRLNALASADAAGGSAPDGAGHEAVARRADVSGTLPVQTYDEPGDAPAAADAGPDEAPTAGGAARVFGTLVPGQVPGGAAPGAGTKAAPPAAEALSRRDAEEQVARLRYVCRLLVHARQPVCAINGVLTLLPLAAVSDVMVAKDMPAAVQNDLRAVRETTRLCCPVTALVTGMEAEPGFAELVRRVGADRAKAHRFGKGYNVWSAPTAENLDAFSAHACGAFEDWVYSLFREPGGLNRPGNAKLYALLCKIRSQLRGRLRNILLHGYSFEPGKGADDETPLLFSGCYFAATGDTEDRQAFVRSVFEKMLNQEEDLEWTQEALAEDDRYHALARVGMGAGGLLVAAIIGMFLSAFCFRGS